MISKKQRKASRFYNDVLKHGRKVQDKINQTTSMRNTFFRIKNQQRERQRVMTGNVQSIPAISYMRRREERTQKQTFLSFIPRSARAIVNFLKGLA